MGVESKIRRKISTLFIFVGIPAYTTAVSKPEEA